MCVTMLSQLQFSSRPDASAITFLASLRLQIHYILAILLSLHLLSDQSPQYYQCPPPIILLLGYHHRQTSKVSCMYGQPIFRKASVTFTIQFEHHLTQATFA
jgi:hypothetical protein